MTGILVMVSSYICLAGCTRSIIHYQPDDFINPNKVVVKHVKQKLPKVKIAATYSIGNDPDVEKAYQHFLATGHMENIESKGFRTLAYSEHRHPILACAPLHLCVVQLEQGENINNIELGDSAHWAVYTALMGTASRGSYQVAIKPLQGNISTDLVITTSKRTYNFGLVSKMGQPTQVVNFYYPQETLQNAVEKTHQFDTRRQSSTFENAVVSSSPLVAMNHLNFDYTLRGDRPTWVPTRIFDDGDKTFIQMPAVAERGDLPVLYLLRDGKVQLTNYRYRQPYYIVDGLFKTAYLISGKGRQQAKVIVQNEHNL